MAHSSILGRPAVQASVEPHRLARWQEAAVWGLWIASQALALLSVVEGAGGIFALVGLLITLSTVSVGTVIVTRLPGHIVGRLLLIGGVSFAIGTGMAAIADYGLNVHPGSVPGAIWLAVISGAIGSVWIGPLVGYVPLFFPTGHLPSARWRVVALLGLVPSTTTVITSAYVPFSPGTYPPGVENPLTVGGIGEQLLSLLNTVSTACGVVALILITVSLVVRYRRASGTERQQIRWFAACATIVVPIFVVAIVIDSMTSDPALADAANVAWVIALGGLALLPVAIGVAILRYRLYEIDRIISRTIGWVAVSGVLGAVFVAVILVAQAALASVTSSNTLAVAASTLVVASLFQPLRRRVQVRVDRRFNRARYDAEGTVGAFAGRLRDDVNIEALGVEITATIARTVQPASVSLWLRPNGRGHRSA